MRLFFMTALSLVTFAVTSIVTAAESVPVIYNCRGLWGYGPANTLCESKTRTNYYLIFAYDYRGINPGGRAIYVHADPTTCKESSRFGVSGQTSLSLTGRNQNFQLQDYRFGGNVEFISKNGGNATLRSNGGGGIVAPAPKWVEEFKNCAVIKR